jgi:PIN domain nuclease of toxin-antitoxin system
VSSVILDASAVLALLQQEAGAEVVAGHLSDAAISAVNLAEVASRLVDRGMPDADIREAVSAMEIEVVSFDEELAYASAALRPLTRAQGLSLGDRACLALALTRGQPAFTADRLWAECDVGVEVKLIR